MISTLRHQSTEYIAMSHVTRAMLGSLLTVEKLEIQNQDDCKDKSADD